MEKLKISFDVTNSDNSCPYHFEALVDGKLIAGIHQVVDHQHLECIADVAEGDHELTFVIANKPENFTKLDDAGNIVKDALLTIDNIKFDDVDINTMVHQMAEYHHTESANKFFGPVGCNGQVKLKFTSPYYLWILENM